MDTDANVDAASHSSLHPVQSFFSYDEMRNTSTCNVVNCPYSVTGRHSNNLTKHIKRNHATLNDNLQEELKEYQSRRKKFRANTTSHVYVKVNKIEFENGLLELVNINGRPFNTYKDSGMLKMIAPILSAFEDNGIPISTSRESLQRQSNTKGINLTKMISEEMKNKVFSLCIDIGQSCDGRSLLAVNAQYMSNGKMVFRCLGMKVNRESNTALKLALLIYEILKPFNVNLQNLISITTDNGANVVKCVKILQILQSGDFDDYLDTDVIERLVEEQIQQMPTNPFLNGIRCVAHTLNLCLDDAMKGIVNLKKKYNFAKVQHNFHF